MRWELPLEMQTTTEIIRWQINWICESQNFKLRWKIIMINIFRTKKITKLSFNHSSESPRAPAICWFCIWKNQATFMFNSFIRCCSRYITNEFSLFDAVNHKSSQKSIFMQSSVRRSNPMVLYYFFSVIFSIPFCGWLLNACFPYLR